ncbi:Ger(x)C family spore germination C-terminal domain-containing protein [Bacillus tianshenii]|nr:Ger(x)C family spore germination C-terminal domain-containing protein [Bacillus tianshenii]
MTYFSTYFWKVVICSIIFFMLTGCWDQKDISQLAIVDLVGFEKDERTDEFIVYFQVVYPSGTASQEKSIEASPVYTISSRHTSLKEAVELASLKLPRKLFFAKTRVILLSQQLTPKDLTEIFNFLERFRETRGSILMAVSTSPLEETMYTMTKLNVVPGAWIFSNFQNVQKQYTATDMNYRIRDVVEHFFNEGNVLFPAITTTDSNTDQASTDSLHSMDASEGMFQLEGGIAFQNKGEPVKFSIKDMTMYHLLMNRLDQIPLTLKEENGLPEQYIELTECTVQDKKLKKKSIPSYQFDVFCKAQYLNSKGTVNLNLPTINKLEKMAEKQLEAQIGSFIAKLKEEDIDLLKLTTNLPKEDKNIKLKEVKVNVKTKVIFNEVGNITNPYKEEEGG